MSESHLERYRLERKIGSKGGFGDVWLATDTLLDRHVAIKCPKIAHDSAQRERFLDEARMLARLNHPNITQIHDAFFDETEGRFYLVMEFVDGKDLARIIQGGTPLPIDWALDVGKGILQALSYVHDQGMVHRDVKPANVMIADDVKLTDFGLARLESILEGENDFIAGTVAYMAPEQITLRDIDGRADLYALGIILFEMLSGGRLPFEYADEVEMLNAHLHTEPPPISQFAPTVPPLLEQVIVRLLAKDPEDRYPSAEVVMDVLDAIHVGSKLSNLPVSLTPFVGREAVLAEINERLQDPACRLLTLVGPGGSGKTRLALEAAAAQLDNHAHGVFFVNLAPLQSVDAIVPTVAEALGITFYTDAGGGPAGVPQSQTSPEQQLLDYLRQKNLLLIMDNYEHLLDGSHPARQDGAGLVTDVLQTAPEVKILSTSRVRLNLQGEHLFPIGGMDLPESQPEAVMDAYQYSAVKLFANSAQRAQPDFELTAENLTDVIRICHLVEGMPLGILLAAGWVKMLSPSEIGLEIGRGLDFLHTEMRDVPERQRSIRAVFDHSWNLLTARERAVMQALSVFRGGFRREAAEKVAGVSLHELMALVDKSLLHRVRIGRYDLHELLRGYAAEKLDRSPVTREVAHDRHCTYYAAALQGWGEDLKGPRQQTALAKMDVEIENARAAWDWALKRIQLVHLDQMLVGLCRFYEWRGRYQEAEAACCRAVEQLEAAASDAERLLLAQVLSIQSRFSRQLGLTELASQQLERSLALIDRCESDDQAVLRNKAYALLELGRVASNTDRVQARRFLERSLGLLRELGDGWATAEALFKLGEVKRHLGAYGEAKLLHTESLTIRRALGDHRGTADSLGGLSAIAVYQGQLEEGERLIRGSIAIRQNIGDRAGIARGLYDLGVALLFLGQFTEAQTSLEDSVALFDDLGVRNRVASAGVMLAFNKWHRGQYEQAQAFAQMYLSISQESGYQREIAWGHSILGAVALAKGAPIETQRLYQTAVPIVRQLGERDELGWVLAGLGGAELALGNLPWARQHWCEALQMATDIRSFATPLFVLGQVALLMLARGEPVRAVELYALASRYPVVANSQAAQDLSGQFIAAAAATLPPDVVAAAQERGRARDLWDTVAELLVELEEESTASTASPPR